MDSAFMNEIKGYIDASGKVTQMPSKRKKKVLVLAYIAENIPQGIKYTEREFNALLQTLHTFSDPATIRRELFDHYLINRNADCTEYEINPCRPTPQELLEIYSS